VEVMELGYLFRLTKSMCRLHVFARGRPAINRIAS
jgi:hypothetical protein